MAVDSAPMSMADAAQVVVLNPIWDDFEVVDDSPERLDGIRSQRDEAICQAADLAAAVVLIETFVLLNDTADRIIDQKEPRKRLGGLFGRSRGGRSSELSPASGSVTVAVAMAKLSNSFLDAAEQIKPVVRLGAQAADRNPVDIDRDNAATFVAGLKGQINDIFGVSGEYDDNVFGKSMKLSYEERKAAVVALRTFYYRQRAKIFTGREPVFQDLSEYGSETPRGRQVTQEVYTLMRGLAGLSRRLQDESLSQRDDPDFVAVRAKVLMGVMQEGF